MNLGLMILLYMKGCEIVMSEINFSEEYFKSFNIEKFRDTINAISARFGLNLDVDKIVDEHKDAMPAELRRLCENPDQLIQLYSKQEESTEEATESLADFASLGNTPARRINVAPRTYTLGPINKEALMDTQDEKFIEILSDIKWSNEFHDKTDRLDKLTGNYFTATRVLVMDLEKAISGFFSDNLIYNKKFTSYFDKKMRHCLSICARYDDNESVSPIKAIVLIKEIIDNHLNDKIANNPSVDRLSYDVLLRQIDPSLKFKSFKAFIYRYIDDNRGIYADFYNDLLKRANSITTDEEAKMVYDIVHNLTSEYAYIISTEASEANPNKVKSGNTKAASKVMKDLKDNGYKAYKIYLKHEQNYDNQATKLADMLKRMVFGDKREQVIEGKTWTPMGILKKLLGTVALFSINPVLGAIASIVLHATDKKLTHEARMEILKELENELAMINEKIEDAKAAGDNKAKYQLMRVANELSEAINKIRIAAKSSDNVKATVKQTLGGGGTGA